MLSMELLAMLAAASIGGSAADGRFQDLDALDSQISAAVAAGGRPVPIDRRIKLANCPQTPEISNVAGGAVAVRCPALGWRIRVSVDPAAVPSAASLSEIVVRRGDSIELVVEGRGYSASALGTSLDEGGAGSRIRVKIPTSAVPVPATVVRAGVASISG